MLIFYKLRPSVSQLSVYRIFFALRKVSYFYMKYPFLIVTFLGILFRSFVHCAFNAHLTIDFFPRKSWRGHCSWGKICGSLTTNEKNGIEQCHKNMSFSEASNSPRLKVDVVNYYVKLQVEKSAKIYKDLYASLKKFPWNFLLEITKSFIFFMHL